MTIITPQLNQRQRDRETVKEEKKIQQLVFNLNLIFWRTKKKEDNYLHLDFAIVSNNQKQN